MLEMYSFVDYFTIPPSFLSIYLGRTWIGKYCQTYINNEFWCIVMYFWIYTWKMCTFKIIISSFGIYIYFCVFSRSKVPPSSAPNDSAWYFAIFKHSKNVEFNSTCSTRVYFYIRVVDRRRNHPSRKYYLLKIYFIYFYFSFILLIVKIINHLVKVTRKATIFCLLSDVIISFKINFKIKVVSEKSTSLVVEL